MLRPHWTYLGQIDCFDVPSQLRDDLFQQAMRAVWHDGGELQLAAAENLYDTDRYDLHCDLPGRPDAFLDFVRALTDVLPDDHAPVCLEGYDRQNLQREDLLIRRQQLLVRPYRWQAQPEMPLVAPPVTVNAVAVAAA